MGKPRHVKQTSIRNDNSRSSLPIHGELSSSRAFKSHNNSKNDNYKQRHRYYKYLYAIAAIFIGSPTYAADVGGVSATANPIANSSGSVTNQAIQVLQGPYITNTYGGGIQCQGATMNVTPYVTGSGAFKRPFERYYDEPVYDVHDADDDGQIDNPGNVLYYMPTRTNQTENYNLSLGVSATWSRPLDKKLQELCKSAAAANIEAMNQATANKRLDFEIARLKNCGELMKAGIMFHPSSPYAKVCADVVLVNPPGVVAQHTHTLSANPKGITSSSVQLSSKVSSSEDQTSSEPDLSSSDTHSSESQQVSDGKGFFRGLRLPWSKPALSQDEKPSGADQLGVLQVGHWPPQQ